MGMASALDTLCGQAYGAKQRHMLGIHMQTAMLVILLASILLGFIWVNTRQILLAVGQDPEISTAAGEYARWMTPCLFAYGLLQCQVKFLQTQNIVFPMMVSSGMTALFHLLVCWILVFKSGLGNKGAALANSISYWVNVLLLALYIKFSPACKKTWTGFSKEAWHDILNFVRLAIPSAVMVCLEFWAFELLVLLSGLLPNPKLETSVLSISTRVSNELGAGDPQAARLAVLVVVAMVVIVGVVIGSVMLLVRGIWGYAYSNEAEVVKYVAIMMPVLATSNFFDGMQSVLSGACRGCGWQKIGACVNLGAYYLVGIPTAVLLAFVLHVGGKGLWMGIVCGIFVQVLSLGAITAYTNWEEETTQCIDFRPSRLWCHLRGVRDTLQHIPPHLEDKTNLEEQNARIYPTMCTLVYLLSGFVPRVYWDNEK
ncbi:Protein DETOXIFICATION 16 [Asimina triloba]